MAVKPPSRLDMIQSGDYVVFSSSALEGVSKVLPVLDWTVSPEGSREAAPLELDFYQSLYPRLMMMSRLDLEGQALGPAGPNSLLRRDVVLVSADLLREGKLSLSEESLAKCVFVARAFFISQGSDVFSVRGPAAAFGRSHTTHREAITACIVNAGAGKGVASDPASVLDLEKR